MDDWKSYHDLPVSKLRISHPRTNYCEVKYRQRYVIVNS